MHRTVVLRAHCRSRRLYIAVVAQASGGLLACERPAQAIGGMHCPARLRATDPWSATASRTANGNGSHLPGKCLLPSRRRRYFAGQWGTAVADCEKRTSAVWAIAVAGATLGYLPCLSVAVGCRYVDS